jgi:hypothetical protein
MDTTKNANVRWHKLSPDLLVPALYLVGFDSLMQWQWEHVALSCMILMVLNIAAVGFGSVTFFSLFADTAALENYKKSLTRFEGAVIGLSAFITAIGFFWWLVPFTAAKQMGVTETGFMFGAVVYFVCYLAVVAGSIARTTTLTIQDRVSFRVSNSVITTLSFFFSYTFLMLTLRHWRPSFMGATELALICLCAFYLPLRVFLLLRPPFHRLEYLTFIVSFAFMLTKLFGQI